MLFLHYSWIISLVCLTLYSERVSSWVPLPHDSNTRPGRMVPSVILTKTMSKQLKSPTQLFVSSSSSTSTKLQFGNTMKIANRLPTRDLKQVQDFLQNPSLIVETVYDASKYTKHYPGCYTIRFASIPIPGIDTITPEITLEFTSENNVINMKSKAWKLTSTKLFKDSKFMNSFNILLNGYVEIDVVKSQQEGFIHTIGSVCYEVEGEKPMLLKATPNFILDKTIQLIQSCVEDFVSKRFSTRYLEAFKIYLQQSKQQLQQQQPVASNPIVK